MIRLIVTRTDATHAANIGGEVERTSSTHLVTCPDLEAALRKDPKNPYLSVYLSHEFIEINI